MTDCTFCMICAHKKHARIVYEDDKVMVIQNKFPKVRKHFLVLPKIHMKDITDQDTPEKRAMVSYIFQNIEYFATRCMCPEFQIHVNYGVTQEQTEFHLHVHILAK